MRRKALGIAFIALALYIGLSLVTYDRWDPSFFTYTAHKARNMGGSTGAYLADALMSMAGLTSFILAALILGAGLKRAIGMPGNLMHLGGGILLLLSSSVMFAMLQNRFGLYYGSGGLVGYFAAALFKKAIGSTGTYIVSGGLLMVSIGMLIPTELLDYLARGGAEHEADSKVPPVEETSVIAAEAEAPAAEDEARKPEGFIMRLFSALKPRHNEPEAVLPETAVDDEAQAAADAIAAEVDSLHAGPDGVDESLRAGLGAGPEPLGAIPPEPEPIAGEGVEAAAPKRALRKKAYSMPSLDLLNLYEPPARRTKEELLADSRLLESKLADFSVKGKVTQVHPGPVVTMNEFVPAPGVKINRVLALADDLALALKARNIRISAVPGKSALGMEVPNPERETVALREIIASESFRRSDSKLTVAFGKDIFGSPVSADLARMPHLLVAGATGSGKSVFMNALVISLLYKARPDEVKMLMIDPKLLELSVYDHIPHLIAPVITSPKDASEMLKRMVFEMERRYRLIAEKGARNIVSFNAVEEDPEERLPYIVVFIDELADLMLASSAQVEDSIARLAQMARAAGIHLVLATQRPSVDVITGVIKANFPARVAFQVTSRVDSRTIIDTQGAEQLIGQGDMLFMVPGTRLTRVHGALVTESEVKAVVERVRSQGHPDYSIMQAIEDAQDEARATAESSEERDDLYWRAVETAEASGEVSISSIQRRLKVGYNRAARMMELMEEDGMVGPPKGAGKPRDFLGRGRQA